ncbi:MAG: hypothetical protein HC853_03475 [Anaerolineae bacterium]|nr:hypothetical protein [Anaerolineae bacterium]
MFAAPQAAGIYRIAVHLGSDNGYFYDFVPGPLYQVRGQAVSVDLFNSALQTAGTGYAFGSVAALTATLRNDKPAPRTVTLSTEVGLPASVVNVTIPANGFIEQPYTTTVTTNQDVRIVVKENNRTLSALIGTVRVRRPSVFTTLQPNQLGPGISQNLVISAAASDVSANTPIRVQVLRGASVVFSETRPLPQIGPDKAIAFSAPLPIAAPGTPYTVVIT